MIQVARKAEPIKKTCVLRCPRCKQLIQRTTSHPDNQLACPTCHNLFLPVPVPPIITTPINIAAKPKKERKPNRGIIACILIGLAIAGLTAAQVTDYLLNQETSVAAVANNAIADTDSTARNSVLTPSSSKTVSPIEPRSYATPTNIIQPPLGITWNDSPLTVAQKLQTVDNLDTCRIRISQGSNNAYCDITREFEPQSFFRSNLSRFLGSVPGIDKKVVMFRSEVTVRPIVIGKGVFELTASFTCKPGSILSNPQKALAQAKQLFGDHADFYCPLLLERIDLSLYASVDTPTVKSGSRYCNTISQTLLSQLTRRYPTLPTAKHPSCIPNGWWDAEGHKIYLSQSHSHDDPPINLRYYITPEHFEDFDVQLRIHQENLANPAHQQRFANTTNLQGKL